MLSSSPMTVGTPMLSNTVAVIVLYQPEGDLVGRLLLVMSQVARMVVVSNDGIGIERMSGLDVSRTTYLKAESNIGLAAGLNLGIAQAAQEGGSWCLLLDQDTVVDTDLVTGLAEAYSACTCRDTVGVLIPNYRSPGGTRLAYPTEPMWQPMVTAVTSGSLVALETVRRVGGMREAFFIEGIDIEFSLRVRAMGLQLVSSGRPLMTHGAGLAEERKLFGKTVLVGHHPPWRCYLQFRNLTWTLWHYGRKEPHWTRSATLSMFKRCIIVCLFERQRIRKLIAMMRGAFVGSIQAFKSDKAGELPELKH